MKDKLLSLANLLRRLKGATPSFFRKIIGLMATLATIGAAIAAVAELRPNIFPPDSFWVEASSHMIVVGIFGAAIAKLTVKDNSEAIKP